RKHPMVATAVMTPSPRFEWQRWPETDAFLDEAVALACSGNAFAAALAKRMPGETGTQFKVWIDHLVLTGDGRLAQRLAALGYSPEASTYSVGVPLFRHSGGIFPPLALAHATPEVAQGADFGVAEVAIKTESVPGFSRAHDLGLEIAGYPMGPYRVARIAGERTSL